MKRQQTPLEQMSAEEQQLEIERRIKAAWRIVIQSKNRRAQEAEAKRQPGEA